MTDILTGRELGIPRAKILGCQKVRRRGIESIAESNAKFNLPKMKNLENQKVGRGKWRVRDYLFLGSEIAAMALSGYVILSTLTTHPKILDALKENKLKRAYESALVRYADENEDGFISTEENKDFYNSILYQNKAQRNPKGLPIKEGKEISLQEFREWIQNYKPYNRFEE
ncbi:MAG: hypothetical protein NTU63_00620 [Candidatus Pacearchaeota archaeon]|nr:hypothetical protein [Candidatus Pacearchaeota archaeon]